MTEPEGTHADPTDDRLRPDLRRAVRAARAKNADDLLVLDLRGSAVFTDWFVICSGRSGRQVKAIADAIERALAAERVKPRHVEGYAQAEWILLDYFDFVVHVFMPETRAFYGLERLWGRATPVAISDGDAPAGSHD